MNNHVNSKRSFEREEGEPEMPSTFNVISETRVLKSEKRAENESSLLCPEGFAGLKWFTKRDFEEKEASRDRTFPVQSKSDHFTMDMLLNDVADAPSVSRNLAPVKLKEEVLELCGKFPGSTMISRQTNQTGSRTYAICPEGDFLELTRKVPSRLRCFHESIAEDVPCRLHADFDVKLDAKKTIFERDRARVVFESYLRELCAFVGKCLLYRCPVFRSDAPDFAVTWLVSDASCETKISKHVAFSVDEDSVLFANKRHAGRFFELCAMVWKNRKVEPTQAREKYSNMRKRRKLEHVSLEGDEFDAIKALLGTDGNRREAIVRAVDMQIYEGSGEMRMLESVKLENPDRPFLTQTRATASKFEFPYSEALDEYNDDNGRSERTYVRTEDPFCLIDRDESGAFRRRRTGLFYPNPASPREEIEFVYDEDDDDASVSMGEEAVPNATPERPSLCDPQMSLMEQISESSGRLSFQNAFSASLVVPRSRVSQNRSLHVLRCAEINDVNVVDRSLARLTRESKLMAVIYNKKTRSERKDATSKRLVASDFEAFKETWEDAEKRREEIRLVTESFATTGSTAGSTEDKVVRLLSAMRENGDDHEGKLLFSDLAEEIALDRKRKYPEHNKPAVSFLSERPVDGNHYLTFADDGKCCEIRSKYRGSPKHASNNVYHVLDLGRACYWQKCHDLECQRTWACAHAGVEEPDEYTVRAIGSKARCSTVHIKGKLMERCLMFHQLYRLLNAVDA